MTKPTTPDPLLAEIETALDLYGISPSRFGYVVVGDPALVPRLREGMQLRPKRRDRIARGLKRIREQKGIPA